MFARGDGADFAAVRRGFFAEAARRAFWNKIIDSGRVRIYAPEPTIVASNEPVGRCLMMETTADAVVALGWSSLLAMLCVSAS
jgi:hypothetical protein